METTDIQPIAPRDRTATDISEDVQAVQRVYRNIMREGTHYGVIPGTGGKPSLWKPGAEKIASVFRLGVTPEVEDLSLISGGRAAKVHYRVTCKLHHIPTGRYIGSGIGECSSDEEKYRWREVSEQEWAATDVANRREKVKRDGTFVQQVRVEPADVANTVLKMAKKRGFIDAVLTATGASDVFTQDLIEDDDQPHAAAPRRPVSAPQAPQGGGAGEVTGRVADIRKQDGTKQDGTKWTKHLVVINGRAYATFSESVKDDAAAARRDGLPVRIKFKSSRYGLDIESLAVLEADAGEAGQP